MSGAVRSSVRGGSEQPHAQVWVVGSETQGRGLHGDAGRMVCPAEEMYFCSEGHGSPQHRRE